jgi:RNA polymerase sigma factor (sigma-70 family)
MTTQPETTDLAEVVRAAQQGDAQAWADLVNRFQDRAMAAALGWSGHWDVAADLAQEAFRLACLHLGELREPAAFAVWFARLVRTACSRASRVRSIAVVPLEEVVEPPAGPEPDLAQALVSAEAVSAARSAVEALPQQERVVVTLFYLAEMSYPEIAEFLEISVPAAKKRAFSARHRLKEMMEMAGESLSSARPSVAGGLRDTVLLFSAIHRRDVASVTALVAARPALARAREEWSPEH